MPDIKRKYSKDGDIKCAVIEIDENVVGLSEYNALSDFIGNEMKHGIKSFSFDLTKLNSINSSGLGVLISCLKKVKDSRGSLKIVNANEKILKILKLTKLDSVFDF